MSKQELAELRTYKRESKQTVHDLYWWTPDGRSFKPSPEELAARKRIDECKSCNELTALLIDWRHKYKGYAGY